MPIVLQGGRKPREVKQIKAKEILGSGGEGNTFAVNVTIERNGREKVLSLVQKAFMPKFDKSTFRDPIKQFEIINELKAWNRKNGNPLRIRPTVRLYESPNGGHRLVMTRFDLKKLGSYPRHMVDDYQDDVGRQLKVLYNTGYLTTTDAFFPVEKNGRLVAFLSDFGNILKLSGSERLTPKY